ncbi:HTH APSES-type domain-containing protein [Fusarium falciforme]|uniref:Transcription factor SWI6 n=1 Tax=Fusarium falciforme TaxID=195108 RepID=A0A9W8V3N9_9HYPO|nr:HTH APSES-type domain-containing protein [Fusarium falciforme]KAJ4194809.1 transcriptional regulator swi6 [Fusarium falciforme]KAJ4208698.1 transcriptional regulator swi6 [Fusarium falciforme]KAJ4243945.1 transcriptional regulator swi6 [Fusarium falciforme]WAO90576.1 HTH APSES-type domain-containing protein [Fusarium falciforme]
MPSASQNSQQSFNMSQQSQSGLSASFHRGYNGDPEGPQIYSASYSGVDVYEMEVNNIAVMRRRNDSWLNATQILKVAGVDKGKRTKILEKEIQTGEHEKVQGGYGKYQGTWITFDRGVQVCRQYGVEELLRPLLTYDMGQDGGVAGRGDFNTPTKEQAMAAQRKRMYNQSADGRPNGLSGTFFKNISSTASHAVAAISKARFDSPGPRSRNGPTRAPSFSRQPSMQNGDDFPGNSQQSFASDYGQQVDSAYSTQQQASAMQLNEPEPPRKRQRVTMTPADSFNAYGQNMDIYAAAFPGSPTEPNESFVYTQSVVQDRSPVEEGNGPLPPLPYEMSPDVEMKRSMLMGLFMEPATTDASKHDMLRTFTPLELDMPIDLQSHTALHWAATLARMPLLRALIAAGASPARVNASGETALMRACLVTNSMDHGSFPDLLEVLGGTIEARDQKGRTVLHHIAVTSAVKGRNAASRYYLESLLEWVVRQGSVPNSQNTQANGNVPSSQQSTIPKMGIARFMSEIVNAQDSAGDTALNIASRIGNRSIISQLLEVGADPNIPNKVGLRPVDFGIGGESTEDKTNGETNVEKNGVTGSSQRSRESSDEIVASITHLLTETGSAFQTEMKSKQASLDTLHSTLRTTSTQLGEARRSLEHLSATLKKQQLARQKVANLSHAREDEQVRLMQEQSRTSQPNPSSSWETELSAMLEAADDTSGGGFSGEGLLPSAAVLRARVNAVQGRRDMTRKMVSALKGRSRDVEVKYRRVVALCTGVQEAEVDAVVDGLLKAVESEHEELEIGRVRRFLGGVEGVVH